jgi:hypothetical protein
VHLYIQTKTTFTILAVENLALDSNGNRQQAVSDHVALHFHRVFNVSLYNGIHTNSNMYLLAAVARRVTLSV